MIAQFGLGHLFEVRDQRRVALPGRAVDALQLRVLLVAAPVGAGDAGQEEVPESRRRRDVRTATEVGEGRRVRVRRDRRRRADFGEVLVGRRLRDRVDDLHLEGLIGEERQAVVDRVLVAHERLVLGDDRAHLFVDAHQVVVTEVRAAGQFEVVVEAVGDRRTDRVVRAGPETGDGLGQDVRARVTDHLATERRWSA